MNDIFNNLGRDLLIVAIVIALTSAVIGAGIASLLFILL